MKSLRDFFFEAFGCFPHFRVNLDSNSNPSKVGPTGAVGFFGAAGSRASEPEQIRRQYRFCPPKCQQLWAADCLALTFDF